MGGHTESGTGGGFLGRQQDGQGGVLAGNGQERPISKSVSREGITYFKIYSSMKKILTIRPRTIVLWFIPPGKTWAF